MTFYGVYYADICKLESNYKTVSRTEDFLSLGVIITEDSTNTAKNDAAVGSLVFAESQIHVGPINQLSNNWYVSEGL